MSSKAYVNLLRFYLPDGTEAAVSRFQNYFINEVITKDGVSYSYLPFALATGAGSRGGERSGETLGLGLDTLSATIATEAVSGGWRARVVTVLLDHITDAMVQDFTAEWWEVSSYSQDTGSLLLDLRSPFDAVQRQFPARVLSQQLVGTLPSTGNIRIGT
jgi:hypothetical protein